MTEPTGPDPVRWTHRWGPWIGFGAAVAILLFGAWLRRHTLDDSFINYRIVNQIEAGNGPVFNVGERVEAFTSPLWLALLTLSDMVLPFRIEWIGMLGGIALGALGLWFAALGARLLHARDDERGRPVLLLPLGAIVIAVFPPVYRLMATGLEDGLTMAWLGASLWALGRWCRSEARLGLWSAVLLGVGVLVRPDLAPFTGVFLLVVLIGDRRSGWKRNVVMLVAAAALPVASEFLRMGYFGLLTPNTAIAKSASLARWGKGWHYLTGTVVPYGFWIPVVALVVIGYVPLFRRGLADTASSRERRAGLVAAAFGAGSLISVVYIVRVGGDYMQARLLLPAIFGIVAPTAFIGWPWAGRAAVSSADGATTPTPVAGRGVVIRYVGVGTVVVWIVVCGLFVRTSADDPAVLFEARNAVTLADFQRTLHDPIVPPYRAGRVTYMNSRLPYRGSQGPVPVLVELGVGKVAYAADPNVYVLDALGLANPISAHEKLRVRGWPGHEKLLTPPWIAAQSTAPGTRVAASSFPRPVPLKDGDSTVVLPDQGDAAGRPFSTRVVTARGVLECASMQRFRASYSAPLTFRRFVSNVLRSWENQRVVIPGEPADAARSLCTPTEQARIAHLVAVSER